jgi:hypothetical protein
MYNRASKSIVLCCATITLLALSVDLQQFLLFKCHPVGGGEFSLKKFYGIQKAIKSRNWREASKELVDARFREEKIRMNSPGNETLDFYG